VEGRVLEGKSFLTCSCLSEELVAGRLIVVEKFWNVKGRVWAILHCL